MKEKKRRVTAALRNNIREIVDLINYLDIKQEDIVQVFKDTNQCTILYYYDIDEVGGK